MHLHTMWRPMREVNDWSFVVGGAWDLANQSEWQQKRGGKLSRHPIMFTHAKYVQLLICTNVKIKAMMLDIVSRASSPSVGLTGASRGRWMYCISGVEIRITSAVRKMHHNTLPLPPSSSWAGAITDRANHKEIKHKHRQEQHKLKTLFKNLGLIKRDSQKISKHFGIIQIFNVFESLFCSLRLHMFVKYCYKFQVAVFCMNICSNIIYSRDAKLNFQHH